MKGRAIVGGMNSPGLLGTVCGHGASRCVGLAREGAEALRWVPGLRSGSVQEGRMHRDLLMVVFFASFLWRFYAGVSYW